MMYRSEDVQKILQIAMTRSHEEYFSENQLQEMAAELGITSDGLKTAEKEWLQQLENQ
jgi:ATP-dependent Lon protease